MKKEGPLLQQLTHRLSECPSEFLMEPKLGKGGVVHVDAVVSDLIMDLGGDAPDDKQLLFFGSQPEKDPDSKELYKKGAGKHANFLRLVLICTWLYHDDWFCDAGIYSTRVFEFLKTGLQPLTELLKTDLFVTDPDRREELVRVCLEALELRPKDESEAQAQDRLDTLNSIKRHKIIQATREREEQARKIRKAMEEKRAREAAARYSPE